MCLATLRSVHRVLYKKGLTEGSLISVHELNDQVISRTLDNLTGSSATWFMCVEFETCLKVPDI